MKTLTKDIDSSVEELEYNKDFTNGCFTKDSSTDSGFTEGDFDKAGFTQGDFTQGSFTEGSFTQVSFTEGDQTEAAPWERCQEDDHDRAREAAGGLGRDARTTDWGQGTRQGSRQRGATK